MHRNGRLRPAKYDNYYFVWSKMECPGRIKRRYAHLS